MIFDFVISAAALFFAAKFLSVKVSVLALIWWMDEQKITHPTSEQLDACRKKVLRQMLR